MTDQLVEELAEYGTFHRAEQLPVSPAEIALGQDRERDAQSGHRRRGWLVALAVTIAALVGAGVALVTTRDDSATESVAAESVGATVAETTLDPPQVSQSASESASAAGTEPRSALQGPTASDPTQATSNTPLPDFEGAVAGDEGGDPLPLGTVNELPNEDRLDFLFEFCRPTCFRDAHFMDPSNPSVGSGPFTAGRPFHIREGFINNASEPLGEGFDVVVYATPMDIPSEFGGVQTGQTLVFTSDYVLRGTSERCGPTYRSQTEAQTCEWFVHDFPEGLPAGRWAIWVFWEAPCSAWLDMGFTESCTDPDEVLSLFSSGVDSPWDMGEPSYTERSDF